MFYIKESETNHKFVKTNLVTLNSKKGYYDLMKCSLCGLVGRRYTLSLIEVPDVYSQKAKSCPKSTLIVNKIKITICHAHGAVFKNLTPGSVHNVVEPPVGYKNDVDGVWVQGVGEPVKVLRSEYIIISDSNETTSTQ